MLCDYLLSGRYVLDMVHTYISTRWNGIRALCRIKLLPVTHVLVDTWMLTVKLVYELSDVPEMGYKHTYDNIYTHFQGITNNIYGFGRPFFAPSFFTRPPIFLPVHIRFYPS